MRRHCRSTIGFLSQRQSVTTVAIAAKYYSINVAARPSVTTVIQDQQSFSSINATEGGSQNYDATE